MNCRGLGDIRTSSNLSDARKIRSPHGAYLELSSIALHRQRLCQEIKAAEARGKVMQRQLQELDRRAGILRQFLDTEDKSVLELLKEPPRGAPSNHRRPRSDVQATRETELSY